MSPLIELTIFCQQSVYLWLLIYESRQVEINRVRFNLRGHEVSGKKICAKFIAVRLPPISHTRAFLEARYEKSNRMKFLKLFMLSINLFVAS